MEAYVQSLLEEARKLDAKNQSFLNALDRGRIVTLQELLSDQYAPQILQANWIDLGILKARVFAGFSFFDGNPYVKKVLPLMFFERSNAKEAEAHHKRLKTEDSWYEKRFDLLPAEVRHLHIHTNFARKLLGKDRLRLPLLLSFSEPAAEEGADWKVGYHVPNLPCLLSVSNTVATEYLARIIVHDIGHGLAPSTPSKIEWLHNLTSLYASGKTDTKASGAWERLVLEECTNPYISLHAKRLVTLALAEAKTPIQFHFIGAVRKWYATRDHLDKVANHFRIDLRNEVSQSEPTIERELIRLRDSGFKAYSAAC